MAQNQNKKVRTKTARERDYVIEFLKDGKMATWKSLGSILLDDGSIVSISKNTIDKMKREDELDLISRGVYQLAFELRDFDEDNEDDWRLEDFAKLCTQIPKGIVCMESALRFWDLSDHMQPEIKIAIPHGHNYPEIESDVPYDVVFWRKHNEVSFENGEIIYESYEDTEVRITSPERTIVDLFRNSRYISDEELPKKALLKLVQSDDFTPKRQSDLLKIARKFSGQYDKIAAEIQAIHRIAEDTGDHSFAGGFS